MSLILFLALAVVLLAVLWIGVSLIKFLWPVRPLHRGEYDRALGRVRLLQRIWRRSAELLFLEGTVLIFANRLTEAEAALRASVAAAPVATGFVNLGWVLSDLGRYEEAAEILEKVIRTEPGWGSAHCALAEVWLRQGTRSDEALALCDQALELRAAPVSRSFDRYMLGYILGNRAWALALLGRGGEARETLARAFAEARTESKPGMAGLHWRAGMALQVLGDAAAAEHFRTAHQLDPKGKYGAQASRAMSTTSLNRP